MLEGLRFSLIPKVGNIFPVSVECSTLEAFCQGCDRLFSGLRLGGPMLERLRFSFIPDVGNVFQVSLRMVFPQDGFPSG
jgi:hypothetical protein